MRTLRDDLNAALFAIYCQATEGAVPDCELDEYEPEDQGVVLRAGDAAILAMARETGLGIREAAATPAQPKGTE